MPGESLISVGTILINTNSRILMVGKNPKETKIRL